MPTAGLALPDLAAIRAAAGRIAPWVRRTPVLTSSSTDRRAGGHLFFKAEPFQRTGAFKFRGAANAVAALGGEVPAAGVVTHSSGNHGAALALAARLRGIPCRVVMPEGSPRVKREAVAGYGAEIVSCAASAEAREETCSRLVAESGARLVHPYDDPEVIAGQGTAVLELLAEVGELAAVVVPIGGGGLASGTALALAEAAPRTAVVGAEPAAADDAARSLASGHRQGHPPGPVETIADGLKAPLSERTFQALSAHLREVVTVEEPAIVEAMRWVWERMKVVIEPSAAVAVAALLDGRLAARLAAGQQGPPRIGVVLSGGNVDLDRLPWTAGRPAR
ncbi:MAG TPA: pyridoxal-phosphate dependent enzyme [Thermoanaerobaculia bacterium]|nr:pyridoxal-phosphate dependent enzyme [Thermoanaerobaculia bacterium]